MKLLYATDIAVYVTLKHFFKIPIYILESIEMQPISNLVYNIALDWRQFIVHYVYTAGYIFEWCFENVQKTTTHYCASLEGDESDEAVSYWNI